MKKLLKQYFCSHVLTIETIEKELGENHRLIEIKKYCHRCGKRFPLTNQDWRIKDLEREISNLSSALREVTNPKNK